MFLTSAQQEGLARCFALLAEDLKEREIRERLGQATLDLFGAQHFASYVWNPQAGCFDDAVSLGMDPDNLHRYEAWYQYRDPITFVLQARRHATLVSEIMPRQDFLRTEFFNDFLFRDGLYWGMNLHAFDGGEALGDLRIWRGRRGADFDAHDKAMLDLIEPAFTAALRRARRSRPEPAGLAGAAPLSPRERAVAHCVSRGLTDKQIARELDISQASVRTYLRRLFAKLGVHRRAGLAAWIDRDA